MADSTQHVDYSAGPGTTYNAATGQGSVRTVDPNGGGLSDPSAPAGSSVPSYVSGTGYAPTTPSIPGSAYGVIPAGGVSSAQPFDSRGNRVITPVGGGGAPNNTNPYSGLNASSGITSSSTPTTTAIGSLQSALGAFNTDDTRNASAAYINGLNSQMQMLETRRQAEIAQIQADYQQQQLQMNDAQTRETGTTTASLAHIGGYLGGSASSTGAMITLAQNHQNEITALMGKRDAAIQAANQAITDQQFKLAQQKLQEGKDLVTEIENRKNNFFDQTLKLQTAQQNEQKATADKLTTLSQIDPSLVTADQKTEIDNAYHIPGFTDSYLKAAHAAAAAKTSKDQTDAQSSYIGLLQKIPAGTTVSMPDGSKVTGIGSSSDYEVFNKENANGSVTVVSFNKNTGQIREFSAGKIGTPSNAADSTLATKLTPYAQGISQLRNPATGYIPTNAYLDMYNSYIQRNPSKGAEFLNNFPVEVYIDPADRSKFSKTGV